MALYHKHRPQTFATVIGQDHIVKTIANQVKQGTVAHAYLFSGPRGIGKTTTARLLAKALNCENKKDKTSEPCNECSTCQEIGGSRSIDVIEIDAASHTGVDNVRENIIENAQFKPTKSPYKVFIIDEVHMLSTSAFNALLKTLEEPPKHVVFILATTEPHKIPDTIISRCQRYTFKKVSYEVLSKQLQDIAKTEKVEVDKDVIDRIVNKSDGCVRDAVSLLDQIMAVGEKHITAEIATIVLPTSNVDEVVSLLSALVSKDTSAGLDIIHNLSSEGIRFTQFADDCIELLRVIMIGKATAEKNAVGTDLSDDVKKELKKLGEQIEYSQIISLIDLFMKRRAEIQSSPLPQLPLEMVVIEWCSVSNDQRPMINDQDSASEVVVKKEKVEETAPSNSEITKIEETATEPVKNEEKSRTKKITEKVKNLVTRDKEPVYTVEEARSKWPKLLTAINGESPSLTFVLKMAEIEDVIGNTLHISVAYGFHRDKLNDKRVKKQIEGYLSDVFETKLHMEAILKEKKEVKEEDSQELQELAAAFGGEVVS